jgi:hypothetical protein
MSDLPDLSQLTSLNAALAKVYRKEGQGIAGEDGIMTEIKALTASDREWFVKQFKTEFGCSLS